MMSLGLVIFISEMDLKNVWKKRYGYYIHKKKSYYYGGREKIGTFLEMQQHNGMIFIKSKRVVLCGSK
jgi:hypothetical protein